MPLILGANSGESILYIQDILNDPDLLAELNANWEFYGPYYLFERVFHEFLPETPSRNLALSNWPGVQAYT